MVVRRQKHLDYYYFYYISTKCTDRKQSFGSYWSVW